MIYSKFKATYDGNHDTFRVEFLVVPTAILAFLVNHDFTPLEVGFCWDCVVADSRSLRRYTHSLGSWWQTLSTVTALHPMCCSEQLMSAGERGTP